MAALPPVVHDTSSDDASDDDSDDDAATKVGPMSQACVDAIMRAVEGAEEPDSRDASDSSDASKAPPASPVEEGDKPVKRFTSGLRSVARPVPPRLPPNKAPPVPKAAQGLPQLGRDLEIEDGEIVPMTELMPATALLCGTPSNLSAGWYPSLPGPIVVNPSSPGPQTVAWEATDSPSSPPQPFSVFPLAMRQRGTDRQLLIEITCGVGGFLVVLIPALYFLFH